MDTNERSTLLLNKRQVLKKEVYSKDVHVTASTKDLLIRNVNIILIACAVTIGGVSKAQYIYKWISTNTVLSDAIFLSNGTSSSNNSQQCATNSSSAAEDEYQRLSARLALYFTLTEKGLALPVLMFFGIYSDRVGRKPLMVAGTIVECIKYGLTSFFIYKDFHINYLFITFGICGTGGTYFTFYLGNFGAIADTTAPGKDRSFSIAFLDAMVGVSGLVAQITTGYMIKITGFVYINMLVAGLFLLVVVSIICLHIETHNFGHCNNVSDHKTSWNISNAVKRITGFYTHKEQRRNMPLSIFLTTAVVFILIYSLFGPRSDIEILYCLNFPLCWSSVKIGYFRAAKDFFQLVIGVLMIKLLHYCTTDEMICIFGCISGIASMVVMGFATNDLMLYIAVVLGIFCIIPVPLIRGIFSKTVLPDKQGALFANLYIFEILCSLGGSTLYNNIYAETQGGMEGTVFLVMAGAYFISGILLIVCICTTTSRETTVDDVSVNIGPSVNSTTSETLPTDTVDLLASSPLDVTNNIETNTEVEHSV
ncbi:proton-coupled folate transporter-like [Argopecten irradians]|uniref:proton-coupled folate transporter-like n=1 Tax=Argopecten irradians TaxID=31199 RepID=UPI003720B2CC